MNKKITSKREKRLRQLMALIIVAFISVFLNGFFMIQSFLSYNDTSALEEKVTSLEQSNSEYIAENDNLMMYISELEYKTSNLYCKIEGIDKFEKPDNYQTGKIAYLTFDDGPTELTSRVLDVLKEYDVKATFFIKGVMIKYNPSVLKRMADEGHTLGNHSTTHKYEQIYTSVAALKEEILETNRRIFNETGYEVKLFRFPGGSSNTMFTKYAPEVAMDDWFTMIHDELGMEYFDWNVSSLDASGTYKTADEIYEAVINGAQDKNQITVLFHDVTKNQSTLEALPRIIEKLLEMGYSIEPLTTSSRPVQHRIAS